MKRTLILLLTLLIIAFVFTACDTDSIVVSDISSNTDEQFAEEEYEDLKDESEEESEDEEEDLNESRTKGLERMFEEFSSFISGDFSDLSKTLPVEALEALSVDEDTLFSDPIYEEAHLIHCESANDDLNPAIYGDHIIVEYQLQAYAEITDEGRLAIETSLEQYYGLTAQDVCAVKYLYIRRGEKSKVFDEGQAFAVKISGEWYMYSHTSGFVSEVYMNDLIRAVEQGEI